MDCRTTFYSSACFSWKGVFFFLQDPIFMVFFGFLEACSS